MQTAQSRKGFMNIRIGIPTVVLLCVALFILPLPVLGADFQAGQTAFRNGDFLGALQEWRPLAEAGDTGVQVLIGHMYYSGQGVLQDNSEAVNWYRRSAEKGNPDGQISLGSMYYQGLGVTKDQQEAARWYRMAADQGSATAQFYLGIMYREGQGVGQDLVQAYLWSRLAADQERPGAKEDKELVAQRMSPAQIAEAEELAKNWKPKRPPADSAQ